MPISAAKCRTLVYARERGSCARCGCLGQSYHHRKKRSQGGDWSPENIVLVCGSGTTGCHGWIEEHPNLAEREGYHVRPWQVPADIPIRTRFAWYLLLRDGTKIEITEPEELAPESGDILRPRASREDATVQTPDETE